MSTQQGASTFVFTDIEGSTHLLGELDTSYGLALRLQRRIIQRCFAEKGGQHMGSEGDGLAWRFPTPEDAIVATLAAQERFAQYGTAEGYGLRVRMGVHCGPVRLSGGEYIGLALHETARICAAAHGEQVLCSAPVQRVARHLEDVAFRELGSFLLRGIDQPHVLFQVERPRDDRHFPAPRDVVRAGGSRLTIWRREESRPGRARQTRRLAASDGLAFVGRDGRPLGADVRADVLPGSPAQPDTFRLTVRVRGVVEEEYDGLTVDGPNDVASVLAAHSAHIRLAPPS